MSTAPAVRRPRSTASAPKSARSRSPWERRPDETGRQFLAFRAYRDAGRTRSLSIARDALAAADVRMSLQYLKGLSAEWGWVERATAYDDDRDRRELDARAAATAADARPFDPFDLRAASETQGLILRLVELLNAKLERLGPEGVPLPVALRMLEIVGTVAPGLLSPDTSAAGLDGLDADALEALRQIGQIAAGLPERDATPETPGPETPAA